MKNILAVDSATKYLVITLKSGDSVYIKRVDEGFTHSEKVLPEIDTLLNEADLKAIDLDLLICSRGPGSFTGLRIGMATLKGISTALNIPLVSIPTLDLYAEISRDSRFVMPVIDARKRSFYTAIFDNGNKISDDLDITPDEILELTKKYDKILLSGYDALLLYEKLKESGKFSLCEESSTADRIIDMGLAQYDKYGADGRDQGPVYIRKSEAELNLEKNKNN